MFACACLPVSEDHPGWEMDIQHDVIEECNKHGGVVHIYVDKNSTEVQLTPELLIMPLRAQAQLNLWFAGQRVCQVSVHPCCHGGCQCSSRTILCG